MMLCFRFTNNSTQSQKNTIYRSYAYDQFGILNFIFAAAIYNKSISYAGFGFGYKIDHHIKLHLSSEHLTNFRIFQIFEAGTKSKIFDMSKFCILLMCNPQSEISCDIAFIYAKLLNCMYSQSPP